MRINKINLNFIKPNFTKKIKNGTNKSNDSNNDKVLSKEASEAIKNQYLYDYNSTMEQIDEEMEELGDLLTNCYIADELAAEQEALPIY